MTRLFSIIVFVIVIMIGAPAYPVETNRDFINETICNDLGFGVNLFHSTDYTYTTDIGPLSSWNRVSKWISTVTAVQHITGTAGYIEKKIEYISGTTLHPGEYWIAYKLQETQLTPTNWGSMYVEIGDSQTSPTYQNVGGGPFSYIKKVTPTVAGNLRFYASKTFTDYIYDIYITRTKLISRKYKLADLGETLAFYFSINQSGPISPSYELSYDGISWVTDTYYTMTSYWPRGNGFGTLAPNAWTFITGTSGMNANGIGIVEFQPTKAKWIRFVIDGPALDEAWQKINRWVDSFTAIIGGW